MPSLGFLKDRRAAVAPMFALVLIPLMAAIGSAVDYSIAARVRTQLLGAADAAVIGAVGKSSVALAAAATMPSDGPVAGGAANATKIFNAEITGQTGYTLSSATATVTKTGSTVTCVINFTAQVPTHFMGLFGISTVPVSGSSTAANSMPIFIDFYLLLDNTPSMGVGASTSDISTMVNNTPDQCAFACHDLSNSNSYYNLAKTLGVTMRINVLRTATQKLLEP